MEEKRMGISGSGLALGATVTLRSVGRNADGTPRFPESTPRRNPIDAECYQPARYIEEENIFTIFGERMVFFSYLCTKLLVGKLNLY
jgi:hypothetical protein